MKNLILLCALVLTGLHISAQQITLNSTVSEVTVYRNKAKETRKGHVSLKEGHTDVIVPAVTTSLEDHSLMVSVKGSTTMLSASVQFNHFNSLITMNVNSDNQRWYDSIQYYNDKIQWINEENSIYQGELDLVTNLLAQNPEKARASEEINKLADVYHVRFLDLRKKVFDNTKYLEKFENKIMTFNNKISDSGGVPTKPEKEIVLRFYSETACEVDLEINYLVNLAGWNPLYDISVANTQSPAELTYKAKVFQNTGYDWKNVSLIVSTYNPTMNNDRPILRPITLDYITYAVQSYSDNALSNSMQAYMWSPNVTLSATGSTLVGSLAPPILTPETAGLPFEKSTDDVLQEFEIKHKQNILTNGLEHVLTIENHSMEASYIYHCVPKMEQAAFLLARIPDFGKYNLLRGNANIYYGGVYVGVTQVDPQTTADTLLVSLGRDERIVVKRIKVKDKCGKKFLTDTEQETVTYRTIIRNNKQVPIEIEILDQIPLSVRKEILVELKSDNGADYLADFGSLKWKKTIAPGKKGEVEFTYELSYPKGKNVQER